MAATVRLRQPDRVPLDYWATPEVDERLMAEFDLPDLAALRRFLKVDMVHVPVPLKEGARKYLSDGDFIDEWGCRQTWQKHPSGGGYRERITAPLADIDSIEGLSKFEFPRLDVYDWEQFSRDLDAYGSFSIYGGLHIIFARHWFLRGMEECMVDLGLRPDFTRVLAERCADWECEFLSKTIEVGAGRIDFLPTYDDWGMQSSLMLSLKSFRECYKEPIRRTFNLARSLGVDIFCHTDGSIVEILDDLVELGVAILNPVQTTCSGMDPEVLERKYGDRVCFHGAIDTQHVLPHGTPEGVRRETLTRIAQFGEGGGYIACSCHNLQPDVPTENIMAMYETVWEFGGYPLDVRSELDRLAPAPAPWGER
ncbi:MAG: uroporphyrinogen decarboxylase family protein [Chloroflexota bacterium]|nr:uroporphyrinogen decarboxylase family protein [Chloroflexota bacterium]